LAAALTCDGCLKNSFTSHPGNIASDFTAAKWRKVILFVIYANACPAYSDARDNG
jgi:hypothetical protein